MKSMFAACLLLASSLAGAQTTSYAGSFLEIPVGAKGLGMGDAFVSLADDGTAFHYNPAGTALIDSKVLSMMYSSQYGSLFAPLSDFFFIGYSQKIQDLNLSLDWVRLSVGGIPREPDLTNLNPTQREYQVRNFSNNGFFSSADDAFYLNISRMYRFNIDVGWSVLSLPVEFPLGISFKLIHRSLDGRTASGIGLDAGLMVRFPVGVYGAKKESGLFSFGLNLRDVTNTRIAWDTRRSETIPASVVWGGSYNAPVRLIDGDIMIALARDARYGDYMMGVQYVYRKLLSVRAGSNSSIFTAGAGIELNAMHVDYAFMSQDLGNVNRVSASFYLDRIFK